MVTYHLHHIVPRHAGGTNDPENLIRVTVEQHAELHFARYLQYGEMGDWMAFHSLSGQMNTQEVILQKASLGGQITTTKHSDKLADWGRKGGISRSTRKEKSAQTNLALGRKEKPVVLTDSNGEEFFFPSLKEAALEKKLHRPNLSGVLQGQRKTVGGYTAKYAN
jgi:hypothetical protein